MAPTRSRPSSIGVLRRFDLGDRWAFHALHADGRSYGLSCGQLATPLRFDPMDHQPPWRDPAAARALRDEPADFPGNGPGRRSRSSYRRTTRRPSSSSIRHCGYFTFGENYGRPNCLLPVSDRYDFRPTRQPVVLDFWREGTTPPRPMFTTIGNWRQRQREVVFRGRALYLEQAPRVPQVSRSTLPRRTGFRAGAQQVRRVGSGDAPEQRLERAACARLFHGSRRLSPLHRLVARRVHRRQGPERPTPQRLVQRSQRDLPGGGPAGGHPGDRLQRPAFRPVAGLFAFSVIEEAVEAVKAINADYATHSRAAADLAREYFDSDIVLSRLLDDLGEH